MSVTRKHTATLILSVAIILALTTFQAVAKHDAPSEKNSSTAKKGTVTKVVAIAKPTSYKGTCPAEIQSVGTIFVKNPPVKVEYEWIRSDGAIGHREKIEIQSDGQGVYDTWTLGAPKQHMKIWEKVHVISPVNKTSAPAHADVHCQ